MSRQSPAEAPVNPRVTGLRAPESVLVVDDHRIFAELLTFALTDGAPLRSVRVASNRAEAIAALDAARVDVAILDIRLVDGSGLDLIEPIRRHHPAARVIALTGYPRRDEAERALTLGASAYLAKDGSLDKLVRALAVATPARPVVVEEFPEDQLAGGTLTPREREVLLRLVAGDDAARIAARLSLSVLTVRSHIKSVLAKLGVSSQLEAVAEAARAGLSAARTS